MADYSNICKNIGDIPDYISNIDLKRIINIGIHDAIRHSNNIGLNSSVVFNITIHEKSGVNRLLRCETSFKSSESISYPSSKRTVVEKEKQNDIVSIDIIIGE